jgi:hypothetical protein
MYKLQIDQAVNLLSRNDLTVMGVMAVVVFLLIWHIVRMENKYNELLIQFHNEQLANKTILIDLATKSILATEKNTQAIINIKDVFLSKT